MKDHTSGMEIIHKDVVVIGNGPSGISLSAMLSGLVPYLKSSEHPDEMLSARLHMANPDQQQINLVEHQKLLEELAIGLEGRTTNPISLLLDALEHPCADLGMEIPSMIEWRRSIDHQIDHVVLGKGPPGGSWHTMDPNVLTLSLGSWMALPGLPYIPENPDSQRRASAGSVARYYENYVKEMNLSRYFRTGINITNIEQIPRGESKKQDTIVVKKEEPRRRCSFVSALNFIRCHKQKKNQFQIRTCKRQQLSPNRKLRDLLDRKYLSVDFSRDPSEEDLFYCPDEYKRTKLRSFSFSDYPETEELCECRKYKEPPRWLITGYDTNSGKQIRFSCDNLVLANGASDLPNRLGLPAETMQLPWVLHDLRTLETKLDDFVQNQAPQDPVLVLGAGLSAADAVIATRFRNIPVIHVFRNRSVSLDKQLPENFYPEYHKVHQMMLDGGSTYPLYTALPEHSIVDINAVNKTVTIASKSGQLHSHKVSFVVILIGSRPNLNFLPTNYSLGVNKSQPVDAKQNPIDISKSHAINGYEGLYAIGPLSGDNFVRFIPGGALAVVSDLQETKH